MTRSRRSAFAVAAASLVASLLLPSLALAAEPYSPRATRPRADLRAALPRIGDAAEARRVGDEVAELLPGTEHVQAEDGREISVDSSVARSLAGSLATARTPKARREAAERLGRHLASLEAAVAPAGPASVRPDSDALAEILGKHRGDARADLAERLDEIVKGIQRWLLGTVARATENRPVAITAKVAFWVVVLALAIALVVLGYRVGRRLHALLVMPERTAPSPPEAPVVAAAEGLPPDALAYAEELAAAGRYREAVRALFGGAARRLVERGVVAQTRTRTDGELLAEVAPVAPAVHGPLGILTGLFERAWYGHAEPGADGFNEARARYVDVVAAAEAAAKGA